MIQPFRAFIARKTKAPTARRPSTGGQVAVILAVGAGAAIVLLVFVLNVAALLSSTYTLDRTVRDAATAGLRSARAGSPNVEEADARAVIEQVLAVELQNVRFLAESPGGLTESAALVVHNPPPGSATVTVDGRTYHGPVVEVALEAHLCPPVFVCVPVRVRRSAALEVEGVVPRTATPVPAMTIQITLTPRP